MALGRTKIIKNTILGSKATSISIYGCKNKLYRDQDSSPDKNGWFGIYYYRIVRTNSINKIY